MFLNLILDVGIMGSIKIKTKIPGPKSLALMNRKKASVSHGVDIAIPIFASSAKNALIKDVDGNVFIDFYGGVGATNSGHSNPVIVNAITKQAEKFVHTCFFEVPYEPHIEVCEKLNKITPGNFKKKSALFNSGAEAVENAVKIARKFTGRQAVVSFEEGFHGRTLMTLSLTGKVKPYKFGFGPFAPETYKLHYPYIYRKPLHVSDEEYIDYQLEYLENDFFKGVVAPENISCIVMEMITGEGGFIVPPKRYVKELRKICKENGILFIADEVQSGFARTGKLFACEHFGIAPDIITTAKSLSNGMPLSAVTGKAEVMDSVQEGGLGGTFSGNPLSCEAAKQAIEFIIKNKLWLRAEKMGSVVGKRFDEFRDEFECVGEARGLGAMRAIEIVKNKKNKIPDKNLTQKIVKHAYENGLLVLSSGLLGNDIRTLMPLTILDSELNEGLDVLEKAIRMGVKR